MRFENHAFNDCISSFWADRQTSRPVRRDITELGQRLRSRSPDLHQGMNSNYIYALTHVIHGYSITYMHTRIYNKEADDYNQKGSRCDLRKGRHAKC